MHFAWWTNSSLFLSAECSWGQTGVGLHALGSGAFLVQGIHPKPDAIQHQQLPQWEYIGEEVLQGALTMRLYEAICFMQLACLVPCARRLTKVSMSSWRTPCLKDNAAWSWLMVFMSGRSRIRASSPSSYTSLRSVRRKQGTRMNLWPHSATWRIQRPHTRQRRPPLIRQRFVWWFPVAL